MLLLMIAVVGVADAAVVADAVGVDVAARCWCRCC
jgi:hypothetical protein